MVSIASTNVNVNNINNHKYATNFRANTTDKLERTPTSDEVDIGTDNKTEKKNSHKALFATAGILGTLATVALLIKKNRYSEIKKLASNIEFKKANTVEEAIEFGKKNFGIKSYAGFEAKDIDVINWFNEGLTNVSNKHNGKLRIPKQVEYTTVLGENTLAGVVTDEKCKYFGHFCINKTIFNNFDDEIKRMTNFLEKNKILTVKNKDNTFEFTWCRIYSKKDIEKIANKIYQFNNKKLNSFNDKMDLYDSLSIIANKDNSIYSAPLINIKSILKANNVKEILTKNNIETNIENIKQLPIDKQCEILDQYIETALKNNIQLTFKLADSNKFQTIYHEMGHLQDNVPRVKAIEKFTTPEEYPKELKEWLNNDDYMQVASSVSDYSCSGPGEFIAETYAELISGNKLPEDVIKLYKKLKGPSISGIT